ncbi:hypothetical protein KSF_107310 [Reticulibacter mediterranei]|uniref:Helicase n=1 Tax=Reticulibacter mediterranei TaxID=2778369 RepID=A0A8J3IU75_9CHLR|nr:helicase-related protein [Reticulibacter mediterranei]GHP00684.1 hypothetical protein KSF_107310 [Reticulibacter mediterranei]
MTTETLTHHDPALRSQKLPSIISLIETVQMLKEVYRPLTEQEQHVIASWPGWGAYAPAFEVEPSSEHWQRVGAQIRMLLGPDGYAAASAATPTSFFTAPLLSWAIWRLATCLGFSGGSVLEPGCGTGQILSAAPADLPLQVVGIEQEPFSASIADLLYPQAQIIAAPLQETALVEEAFDLVVGNVPFADVPIYDRTLPFQGRLRLHNYCIYRALQAARPGSLVLLITSRYTLDAKESMARDQLATLGKLLGAIRLPGVSHQWAKTGVVTDLLVLQRRSAALPWPGHAWKEVKEQRFEGGTVPINAYFAQHPEQMLGIASVGRGLYHEHELLVHAPDDLEAALEQAIGRIVQDAQAHQSSYVPRFDRTLLDAHWQVIREDGRKEGCFYLLEENGLVQISDGQPKVVTKQVDELTALVVLRDRALALVEAEGDYHNTDEDLLPLRTELNRCYDAYVEQYGPIRRSTLSWWRDKETGEEQPRRILPPAIAAFKTDEQCPLLLSLEESYDEATKQAQKAAIFFRRINCPAVYKETAESREEALALSLDRFGRVDFAFIARATGQPLDAVASYLGELVYEDPETQLWQIAPIYLSGNVRHKLEVARRALRTESKWQRNVEALERVQPTPIPPEHIKVLLGAPWIPAKYLVQFCEETFKLKPEIVHDRASGAWFVSAPLGVSYSALATSTWGTQRVHAFHLVEQILNHRPTQVEDTHDGKVVVNVQETRLAQQKRKEIQARFPAWVWEDYARTQELSALYNKLYNGVVPTSFHGEHLSFPGMNGAWQQNLYSWQRDFLARMINSRSGLCAYPVGAGKTKIEVAGALTLRRMQLIQKAAILVPNHLLEQIAAEAKQLYPGANILMIAREDLARDKRRLFMARIATGDYDLVIMTHSAFEAINVHPETKREHIRQQIREYQQVLCAIAPTSRNRAEKRRIKQLEKQIQRMRERLNALLDLPHDAGLTFEQLGISYIIVDEAHQFKNLGLPTNQEKLQVKAAKRSQDLLMKLRWLEQHNGRRPFTSFFTATPISNSMVEAFVMLWYLDRPLLEAYELFHLDDFASMFIETEEKVEVTPTGAGFRSYERPRAFINLPEFLHLFASVVDLRSPEILADKRPDRLEHTIAVEPTEEVSEFVSGLVERSERLHLGNPMRIHGKRDNMLWVTGDGRMAALWLGLHGKPEAYPAKLDAIATQMAKVYHRWQEHASYLPGPYKSLQIGFCDMGTPHAEKGEQVYGEIKRLLVEKGIPAAGIRYVHEAGDNAAAKEALFEQCRTGQVAILLGSTKKLGTGTNIQTRCAAVHHCDAPWRPDEVEQREGRCQRPGNLYPVVEIFYYVQRRTFDAYSWQILANKARPFNQLRSGAFSEREIAYNEDSELTYGQVKAAATGDVLLLEHANLSLSIEAYAQLHASYERARQRDHQEAHFLFREAERYASALKRYEQIERLLSDAPFVTPGGARLEKKEERTEYLGQAVLSAVGKKTPCQPLGSYRGVPIFFKVNLLLNAPYVFALLDPEQGCEVPCFAEWLEPENQWRFAWKIEQFLQNLPTKIEEQARMLANRQEKAQAFEAEARRVFPDLQAWENARARKQQLDDYIHVAAKAKSEEEFKHLAEVRQTLLEAVPAALLTERSSTPSTAKAVLPPRHPDGELGKTVIAVDEMPVPTQTARQVAQEIQHYVLNNNPWHEPIVVTTAAPDDWAALRQQYGHKPKRRRKY